MAFNAFLFVCALACSMSASAQSSSKKSYVEFGAMYGKYSEPSGWFTSGLGVVTIGTNLSDGLAMELVAGTSIADTNFYVGSTRVSARFDSVYGGFIKAYLPSGDKSRFYGRVGFISGQISASTSYGSAWTNDTDIAIGGGVEFDLDSNSYVNIGYTNYYNKAGVTVNGTHLTFGTRF